MASLNKPNTFNQKTHEGAPAARMNDLQALRRSVMSCFLWEDTFYESGVEIGKRIEELAFKVKPHELAALAIEARHSMKLRHVPLLLLAVLCKTGSGTSLVSDTIENVISRPDEMAELLAIYWKDGKKPLSAQLKKGLGRAFRKFDAYQLGKYNRDQAIKLRDVLFLAHPKPTNLQQQAEWDSLAAGTLASPDTWEVALSGGADKKDTFERLMREGKLGYMAVLRNLRNMITAGVDDDLIRSTIIARKGAQNILPFRFLAAARHAVQYEKELDQALIASIQDLPRLKGRTIVLVDVSGSMGGRLSGKSELTRQDAAACLASVVNGEKVRVFSFDTTVREIPARQGMAGIDAINRSGGGGTDLGGAVDRAAKEGYDRLIVITDEQSHTRVNAPLQGSKAYMINVASYQNGVGYGNGWTHIDGFSENIFRFIAEMEASKD